MTDSVQSSGVKKDVNPDLLAYILNELERTLKRLDTLEITGEINVEHYTDIVTWLVHHDGWRHELEYRIGIYNEAVKQIENDNHITEPDKMVWEQHKAIK